MIRVLQLCSTSDMGGAERMALNLSSALNGRGYEMHVGALVGSGALIEKATAAGLAAVHFHFRFPADPSAILRLVRYCRQHKIDIVQTHGLRADGVARWATRLGGVKVVISTIHSIDPWRRSPHVALDKLTAPFVTHYVAVCQAARDAAISRGEFSISSSTVVPIGVPAVEVPRHERDSIRSRLGLSEADFPIVGMLANLREMKGHLNVIAALPEIRQHLPGVKFLFAGRDDSNGAIRQAARAAGVEDAINFLGFVEQPSQLFAVMDVCLLASDWEGFPVSILEAMQAGVPVVATNVGGIPEMIDHGVNGLLIPPKNPGALADAIITMSKDFALRASLVKSADARYQSEFTLDSMALKMSNLYEDLLKKAC